MQYIKLHFIGSLFSSVSFLVFFYLYVMVLEGNFDYLSLPFIILFVFPIYFIVGNPITSLIRFLLNKYFFYHIILLTFIVMIIAFLFIYGLAMIGVSEVNLAEVNYFQVIIFCFISALPSVLGIEYIKIRNNG